MSEALKEYDSSHPDWVTDRYWLYEMEVDTEEGTYTVERVLWDPLGGVTQEKWNAMSKHERGECGYWPVIVLAEGLRLRHPSSWVAEARRPEGIVGKLKGNAR